MLKEKKLSVVIPCFNEAKNVTVVLKKLDDILSKSKYNIEIIVVDGGSTDSTPDKLKKAFKKLDQAKFKLLLMPIRGGYGNDIMHALDVATGDVLAWTHADLQTDPYDVIKAFKIYLDEKNDVFIKGRRKNRQFIEAFFTLGMQICVWFVLKIYLSDINAQPKLFSRKFYEKYLKNDHPHDFSLDLFAMYQAKKNGYKIKTFPVYFAKRLHGEAKGGGGGWKSRIKLINRTFKYIVKLKNKL